MGRILDKEDELPRKLRYHPDIRQMIESGNSSKIGNWGEIFAIQIALQRGADVFRNAICVGSTDIVLRIDGQFVCIDVKVARRHIELRGAKSSTSWKQNNVKSIAKGVYGVAVIPAETGMYCRWYNDKKNFQPICPPGMQRFWTSNLIE